LRNCITLIFKQAEGGRKENQYFLWFKMILFFGYARQKASNKNMIKDKIGWMWTQEQCHFGLHLRGLRMITKAFSLEHQAKIEIR